MKKASVVLSTLILLSSVAGCTATNETTARETRNDDTDVTIVQSDEPDETDVTDPSNALVIPMIPDGEIKIDYVPEDHGRVIPFLAVYEEDEWMPEGNRGYNRAAAGRGSRVLFQGSVHGGKGSDHREDRKAVRA